MLDATAYLIILVFYIIFTLGLGTLFNTEHLTSTFKDKLITGLQIELVFVIIGSFVGILVWAIERIS